MNPSDLRKKLHGVIAFPVTPFNKDYSLNLEGLRSNLRVLIQQPLCAVVAAGGTGEMFSLTPEEQLAALEVTLEEVGDKAPVLAATGFNGPMAVAFAKKAAAAGASGILAFPPYYPNADAEGLFEYYRAIGDATSLGLLIYSRDWANFSPAAVEQLAEIPTLIAWKDGQGDIRRYQMIQERLGDRLHWIGGAGDDLVGGYYSLGIRTYTSSIANVAPKLSIQLHETAARGDHAELRKLMSQYVVPLYALRARRKGYEVSIMKEMMDMLGLAGGPVRAPLANISAEDRQALEKLLPDWRALL